MSLIINTLNAADEVAGANKGSAIFMQLLPFILIFVVFYFLLIRPQRKKQKLLKDMINSIKPGDKVLLNSGMTGRVVKLKNTDYLVVEISAGVEVEVLRTYVINVINNTEN